MSAALFTAVSTSPTAICAHGYSAFNDDFSSFCNAARKSWSYANKCRNVTLIFSLAQKPFSVPKRGEKSNPAEKTGWPHMSSLYSLHHALSYFFVIVTVYLAVGSRNVLFHFDVRRNLGHRVLKIPTTKRDLYGTSYRVALSKRADVPFVRSPIRCRTGVMTHVSSSQRAKTFHRGALSVQGRTGRLDSKF